MPLVGVASAVALASMAGIPGTTGFLSKELMLAMLRDHGVGLVLCLVVSAGSLVATACRLWFQVFRGDRVGSSATPYRAPIGMQIPPLLLSVGTLVVGCFPAVFTGWYTQFLVPGLHASTPYKVSVWHGITPELIISGGILLVGCMVYQMVKNKTWVLPGFACFDRGFNHLVEGLPVYAKRLHEGMKVGDVRWHVPIVLLVCIGVMIYPPTSPYSCRRVSLLGCCMAANVVAFYG